MSVNGLATLVLIGGFFLLMMVKVPITFAMFISACGSCLIVGKPITEMCRMMLSGVNNFTMLAIPFFIVMGEIMAAGQISDKIVDAANLLVGRFRGGLAYVNCIDSMFFGGISGSAVADVSSLGSVVIPMMVEQGYDEDFSVALTVTTSCQGVLIPPSHNMVIFALAYGGGISVGSLFYAGILPGIALGLGFMLMCFLLGKRYKFPKGTKMFADQKIRWIGRNEAGKLAIGPCMRVVIDAILPMMTLVIILVGTGAGIFTATEASAVACFYTFILTYFVFRTARIKDFGKILKNSLKTLAIVLTLIATAKAFAYMMTFLRIPALITNAIIGVTSNPVILILLMIIILLILGCFMDMAPLIMIMTPILKPVAESIGMAPIHFGILIIFTLAIGLCTPPVGSALFVGCAVGHTKLETTSRKMLPLLATMVVVELLVVFIPYYAKMPLFGY